MINNSILRSIRYAFDLSDSKMIKIFDLGGANVSREEVCDWLKQEEDPAFLECSHITMASFLAGFIIHKRGPHDGPARELETHLNNNIVFRKLKIALNLQDQDILDILSSVGVNISKHELSAFFRKSTHKHYRACKDQNLRKFLQGLQLKYRKPEEK